MVLRLKMQLVLERSKEIELNVGDCGVPGERGEEGRKETHLEPPALMMQVVEVDIVGVGERIHGVPRDLVAGVIADAFEDDDGGEAHALLDGEASGREGESDGDAVEKDAFNRMHVKGRPAPRDV